MNELTNPERAAVNGLVVAHRPQVGHVEFLALRVDDVKRHRLEVQLQLTLVALPETRRQRRTCTQYYVRQQTIVVVDGCLS